MRKLRFVVEFDPVEVDESEHEPDMSFREIAERLVEDYESDPALLLELSIERVRYRVIEE